MVQSQSNPLLVQVATFENTGDVVHRLTWPAKHLAAQSEFNVLNLDYRSRYRYDLCLKADLLVLHMLTDADIFPILEERKRCGRPTVYELNDNFYDLQPWSPVYRKWSDPKLRRQYELILQSVDYVQVPSEGLRDVVRNILPPSRITVMPNHMDDIPSHNDKVYPTRQNDTIQIGWGGSLRHVADLAAAAPALTEFIKAYPNTCLNVMGNQYLAQLFDIPNKQLRFVPWGSLEDYLSFIDGLHIGLCVGIDTPYNRCASDAKYLEYASRGTAVVARNMRPFDRTILDGKTGMLYDSVDDMIACISRLVNDKALMEDIGRNGYNYVNDQRRYEDNINDRISFYRKVLNESPLKPTHVRVTPIYDGPMLQTSSQPHELRLSKSEARFWKLHAKGVRKPDRMLEELDKLKPRLNDWASFHLLAAEAYQQKHDTASARECLKAASSANAFLVTPILKRAQLTLADRGDSNDKAGQGRIVCDHLESAIQINPISDQPYYALAKVLRRSRRLRQARDVIERLLEVYPEDPRARFEWLSIQSKITIDKELLIGYTSAIEFLDANYDVRQNVHFNYYHDHLADTLDQLIKPFRKVPFERYVADLIQQALFFFPQSADLWTKLGELRMSQKNYQEAKSCFENAMELLAASAFRKPHESEGQTPVESSRADVAEQLRTNAMYLAAMTELVESGSKGRIVSPSPLTKVRESDQVESKVTKVVVEDETDEIPVPKRITLTPRGQLEELDEEIDEEVIPIEEAEVKPEDEVALEEEVQAVAAEVQHREESKPEPIGASKSAAVADEAAEPKKAGPVWSPKRSGSGVPAMSQVKPAAKKPQPKKQPVTPDPTPVATQPEPVAVEAMEVAPAMPQVVEERLTAPVTQAQPPAASQAVPQPMVQPTSDPGSVVPTRIRLQPRGNPMPTPDVEPINPAIPYAAQRIDPAQGYPRQPVPAYAQQGLAPQPAQYDPYSQRPMPQPQYDPSMQYQQPMPVAPQGYQQQGSVPSPPMPEQHLSVSPSNRPVYEEPVVASQPEYAATAQESAPSPWSRR